MLSLDKYNLEMVPIPERMEAAIQEGVRAGEFPAVESASQVFDQWQNYADRVLRSDDGRVMVCCTTALPGVSPAMIDWWFGWHLPESERYRLWHPLAHVRAQVKEDRSDLSGERERYLGNVSYVDEYIGKKLMHLAIAFFDPGDIGLGHVYASGATAICANTSDRTMRSDAGQLVHLVIPTPGGSEMRSVFWLGKVKPHWPVIGSLLTPILNTATVRRLLVGNQMATELLRHCAEEMNHLPRFLPALHSAVTGTGDN